MTLATVSAALSQALSAVSSSITGYFSKASRFPVEFFAPAAAFVLGCLAVLMAIVGPDVPRAWWDSLGGDLKLLVLALLILLLVLITEASRPLALLVRQLYSGEWPAMLLSQRRRPFLVDQVHRLEEARYLDIARGDLEELKGKLSGGSKKKEVPVERYPVLKRPIGAYQVIAAADWQWDEAPKGDGAIKRPDQLIGRYSLQPLPSGQPVPAAAVKPLPNYDYLSSRQVVWVDFFAGDVDDDVVAGLVVTLYVRTRGERPTVVAFPDLFVAERSGTTVALAVPPGRVESLLILLPGSRPLLAYASGAMPRMMQAIPVVRVGESIARGQLIRSDQVDWEPMTGAMLDALVATFGPVATQVKDVEGKIYWPEDGAPAHAGSPFFKNSLRSLNKGVAASWFTFTDDGGQARSRLAYRLSLAPGGGVTNPAAAGKDDRVAVEFRKRGTSGKRELLHREPWCYVYELRAGEFCELAVRDREEFDRWCLEAQGGEIRLNPFVDLPVLSTDKKPAQLISTADLVLKQFRANDTRLVDACETIEEAEDRYTTAAVVACAPIPRQATAPAKKASADWLLFTDTSLRVTVYRTGDNGGQQMCPEGLAAVQRGDLVTAEVVGGEECARECWSQAYVRSVDQPGHAVELAVPAAQKSDVTRLWKDKATRLKLTITHSDASLQDACQKLRARIGIEKSGLLQGIDQLLEAADPAEALKERQKHLDCLLRDLARLRTAWAERPWQVKPLECASDEKIETVEGHLEDMQKKLYDIIRNYIDTAEALSERRLKNWRLALPDEVGEVRASRLGNILAAAADYPERVYGIDTPTVLPRLLNVLKPEEGAVTDSVVLRLIHAEASLNMMLLFSFWAAVWAVLGGVALLAFGGTWWMFLVVVLGGALLWWLTRAAAESQALAYGEALKPLFDLRRYKLLEAMGYPLTYPISPEDERKHWQNLNSLFALGVVDGFPALNKPGDQGGGK